jgi:hypothetical protein
MDEQEEAQKIEKRIETDKKRMAIPGLYIDRFSTLQWKNHVRITFGESGINGEASWRTAVIIEKNLMKRLAHRLLEIIKEQDDENTENNNDINK